MGREQMVGAPLQLARRRLEMELAAGAHDHCNQEWAVPRGVSGGPVAAGPGVQVHVEAFVFLGGRSVSSGP